MNEIPAIAELGAQVAIVVVFIWYLSNRNSKMEKAMSKLHKQMAIHLRILIKIAENHDADVQDLVDDYDDV